MVIIVSMVVCDIKRYFQNPVVRVCLHDCSCHYLHPGGKKKPKQITCLEKQMVYLKKRFNFVNSSLLLYALFLSVIMRYVIMVYHISGVFIYLKTNPHAVFISFWFRQKKFFKLFFVLLSKWRPTLMKIFPQSHIVGQGQSRTQNWVSVMGIQTPCWVSNFKVDDTYSLHILAWQCMSLLSCRCRLPPNDLRVKDWGQGCWCGGEWLTLSQRLMSCRISVFPYQALLPPVGQLLCNSRQDHFFFHSFLSMIKIRDEFLKVSKQTKKHCLWDSSGNWTSPWDYKYLLVRF